MRPEIFGYQMQADGSSHLRVFLGLKPRKLKEVTCNDSSAPLLASRVSPLTIYIRSYKLTVSGHLPTSWSRRLG